MPHHMHGDNAERRYVERDEPKRRRSEAEMVCAAKRNVPYSDGNVFDVEAIHGKWFREERMLSSMSKVMNVEPAVVLKHHAKRFSPEFLFIMGVPLLAA